ncbi:MAG: hypothetical protein ACE5HR_03945 [bacterium]
MVRLKLAQQVDCCEKIQSRWLQERLMLYPDPDLSWWDRLS